MEIYPMYDYAHPIGDAIEGVTHSICTLEFEDHRPLYDWTIIECEMESEPHQYEFARLNMTNTIMSKRYLKSLVDQGVVESWDDPRMPTISGLRRKGFTAEAIRAICREIGVARAYSVVDERMLEFFIREDLKLKAPRTMAVLSRLRSLSRTIRKGNRSCLMQRRTQRMKRWAFVKSRSRVKSISSRMTSWRIRRINISVCSLAMRCA